MSQNDNEQLNIETVDDSFVDGGALADESTPVEQVEPPISAEETQVATRKRKINKFWDILLWVLIAILAVGVLVKVFVFTNVTISGDSMNQTYSDGDVVRVIKIGKPKRGDVVVFYKNDVDSKFKALFARGDDAKDGGKYEKLIKRVVAVEGDKIWIEQLPAGGYQVVVKTSDGEKLREDYYTKGKKGLSADSFILPDSTQGLGRLSDHVGEDNALVIEKGYFFAMGDNRGNSEDSRGDLGQVPIGRLFGIVRNK